MEPIEPWNMAEIEHEVRWVEPVNVRCVHT